MDHDDENVIARGTLLVVRALTEQDREVVENT